MKRKECEELRGLMFEIEALKQLRDSILTKEEEQIVCFKDYRHSSKGIPKASVGIGYDYEAVKAAQMKINQKIKRREVVLNRIVKDIEKVSNAEMRTILILYYCNGMSQHDIGERMGYAKNTIKSKLQRFWK